MCHVPVLLRECLGLFRDRLPASFLDVTLGAGGHAHAFLSAYPSITSYHGRDRDPYALSIARENLKGFGHRVQFSHGSFKELDTLRGGYDGILADLGVSSMQLDALERGFSFQGSNHPLDMRMDTTQGEQASDLLNTLNEEELGQIFWTYGGEPLWRQAARAIVRFRRLHPIAYVQDLKDALVKVFPSYRLRRKIHPLTLIFQALRVYVNKEHEQLRALLNSVIPLLSPGGRVLVISFCSTEDRPVKWFFKEAEAAGAGRVITKKVIMPTYEEVRRNPRCRSAKLRCFEKK